MGHCDSDYEYEQEKERKDKEAKLRVKVLKDHINRQINGMTDDNLELASALVSNVELVRGFLKLVDDLQDSRYIKIRD